MTTEQRLARLERSNRRLLLGLLFLAVAFVGAGAFLGSGGVFAAASEQGILDLVRARAFHVIGKDGTPLVKLEGSFGNGQGLGTVTTLNRQGGMLVNLGATPRGDGAVATYNGKGQQLVVLGLSTGGSGMVTTLDPRSIKAMGVLTTR